MLISFNWLKDLVEISDSPQQLAEKLTRAGNAVEGVSQVGDDHILDFDLTSNRSDCLSHLGIAREYSAISDCGLRIADSSSGNPKSEIRNPNSNSVTLDAPAICLRFTARIIRGVKVGPSPDWLVKRLEAVGELSINNIADITNYVMHELGQPMHSFDLDKLSENRIVVRRAKIGEKITTLDEVERELDDSMLAICDAEKPVAVAGVMGGLDSGISDSTTNVLLEVAYFDRASIRKTARALKLNSEASHRFERGVDIENLVRASNRATELILELAGGTAEDLIDVYPTPVEPKTIECADIAAAVTRLTGLEIHTVQAQAILAKLGILRKNESEIRNPKSEIYFSPSWRHDINIPEDLVEEIARVIGYDTIAEELPPAFGAGEYQPAETRKSAARRALREIGYDEAISYSFIDAGTDGMFETVPGLVDSSIENPLVTLQDSIIEGAVRMRPTLLAGLLDAVRTNFNQQRRDVKLFEIGKVFAASKREDGLPTERELVALAVSGGEIAEGKAMQTRETDFYDAKGAVELLADAVGAELEFRPASLKHLRTGQTAEILSNGNVIGFVGRLNDAVAVGYKFRQPVFVAELDLDALLAAPQQGVFYAPLPVYPSSVRDISVLVKRDSSFTDLRSAILNGGFGLLKNVEYVDVFEGKGMAEDERSLTIRLEYRSDERTLKDEEVDGEHGKIVELLDGLGARLRS